MFKYLLFVDIYLKTRHCQKFRSNISHNKERF